MNKNIYESSSEQPQISAQFNGATAIKHAQIGNNNVINNNIVVSQPPQQIQTEETIPLVELLRTRNPRFTGRDNLFKTIGDKLKASNGLKRVALTGMGGIGKTQAVLEYAFRHREDYRIIFWLDASNQQLLLQNFDNLAEVLGLLVPELNIASNTQSSAQDQLVTVKKVLRYLERRNDWLLIFNNASDAKTILNFLPSSSGYALITSRDDNWSRIAETIPVNVLSLEESVEFLKKAIAGIDENEARDLSIRLHGLPLALEQAASYVLTTNKSCSEYIKLFDEKGIGLFGTAPLDYEKTIATTWEISTGELSAAALTFMQLCAFFHAENIDEAWLKVEDKALPPGFRDAIADPVHFDNVIIELKKFSLIDVIQSPKNNRLFSVHRLVQQVCHTQLNNPAERVCACVMAIVNKRMNFDLNPDVPADWDEYARLLPHVQQILEHAKSLGLYDTALGIPIRSAVGIYLYQRQQHVEAASILEPVLVWIEKHGRECDICVACTHLGVVYRELGKHPEALSLYLRALEIDEKTHGQDSPQIVIHLNNVGSCYRAQNVYSQAEAYLLRAIKNAEQSDTDFDLISPLSNLADSYRAEGKIAKAESLFAKALIVAEKYESSHPHLLAGVLASKAGLAVDSGNPSQAIPDSKRALRLRIKTYGKESLPVAHLLGNIGAVYGASHKTLRAAKCLHTLSLKIKLKLIDNKNVPEIAIPYVNLAAVHLKLNEDIEALRMVNEALSIFRHHNNPRLIEEARALDLYALLVEKIPGKHREVKRAKKEAAEIRSFYATQNSDQNG